MTDRSLILSFRMTMTTLARTGRDTKHCTTMLKNKRGTRREPLRVLWRSPGIRAAAVWCFILMQRTGRNYREVSIATKRKLDTCKKIARGIILNILLMGVGTSIFVTSGKRDN